MLPRFRLSSSAPGGAIRSSSMLEQSTISSAAGATGSEPATVPLIQHARAPGAIRSRSLQSASSGACTAGSEPATVPLIQHADASSEVRAVYEDIMAKRMVPDVNNFWKAIANHPPTLRRTWSVVPH